ncbi:MAG: hypothetical protein OXI77_17300 [Chloroflexota bacterium]|nr:hypothetical protein [Chloroflexota bacterium]MDE2907749.1 hypothetical protein [Chloroflexota bacterium]
MFRRLWLTPLMLTIVIALLPVSLAQADCDFSYSNYARAVQLHDMGDYAPALKHYQCALLEDPDDAIIPLLIENVYEDIADAPTAWARPQSAARATACDPARDHAQLGGEAHDAGDYVWARIHLHCALLADPSHVDALYRMGMIHVNRGETHEAKHYFDRVERAADTQAVDLLTILLGADARSVLGADALQQLRLRSPDPGATGEYLPPSHEAQRPVLRVIWTRQGQAWDEAPGQAEGGDAFSQMEWALAQDPTRVDLRCELGRRYMAQGDFAAAYGQFAPLIAERLGDHCGGANRPFEQASRARISADELERALKREPSRADLRCELGRRYKAHGKYAAAYGHFTYLIREKPGDYCRG